MKVFWLFANILMLSPAAYAQDILFTDSEGIVCDYSTLNFSPDFERMITDLVTPCDERIDQVVSITDYDQRLRAFKNNVCSCVNPLTPRNLDSAVLQGLDQNAARSVRRTLRGRTEVSPEAVARSVASQNVLLNELRNGVMIQASILSPDPTQRDALTAAYSGRDDFQRLISEANTSLARRGQGVSFTAPVYDESALQGGENSCPTMRQYRHFRQFPSDNEFYQDLLHERNQSFRSADWNFEKLKRELGEITSRKRILSLQNAKADPDAGWIIRRMDFLMRNPLLKNFFQQGALSRGNKTRLFELVKQTFRPPVGPQSCLNAPGACQGYAATRANIYQTGLREFFRDPDIVERVVDRDVKSMGETLRELPERVTTSPVLPDPSSFWRLSSAFDQLVANSAVFNPLGRTNLSIAGEIPRPSRDSIFNSNNSFPGLTGPIGYNGQLSDPNGSTVNPNSSMGRALSAARATRLQNINNTCNLLSDSNLSTHGFIFSQLEQEWSEQLCDPDQPLPDGSHCQNPEIFRLREGICSRKDRATGETIQFTDFKERGLCTDPTIDCSAQFITNTSAIHPGTEQMAASWATVFGVAPITKDMSDAETRNIRERITRNNSMTPREQARNAGANITREFTAAPVTSNSVARTPGAPEAPGRLSSGTSTPSGPQQFASPEAPVLTSPLGAAPAAPVSQPTREALRSQVRQSETDAQAISSEISTLRESLLRERDLPPANQDTGLINSLTERLAALERKYEAEVQKTARLRRDLARVPERETPAGPAPAPFNQESSRSVSPRAAQTQTAPQGGQQSGATSLNAPAVNPLAAPSLPGSNVSLPAGARSSANSGNSALLSKYGVQSASNQGAITVASPSSSIDYESLRNQSSESVLRISLTPEEFGMLGTATQEALGRYLDQVRAMPGEVVRLAITDNGSNTEVEYFILKNESGISLVPSNSPSRAIASEAEPVSNPQREITLEQLQSELQQ